VRAILSILGTLALATTMGCSSLAEDACDEECRCQPCSDREFEDCVIRTDAQLDVYDVYGCDVEAEDLYACAIDRGTCRNDHWTYSDVCDREVENLDFCVGSASLLRGQPAPGPN
jgi:hypothetical protein